MVEVLVLVFVPVVVKSLDPADPLVSPILPVVVKSLDPADPLVLPILPVVVVGFSIDPIDVIGIIGIGICFAGLANLGYNL